MYNNNNDKTYMKYLECRIANKCQQKKKRKEKKEGGGRDEGGGKKRQN